MINPIVTIYILSAPAFNYHWYFYIYSFSKLFDPKRITNEGNSMQFDIKVTIFFVHNVKLKVKSRLQKKKLEVKLRNEEGDLV